mgnify:CR=1 FL=1
MKGDVLNLLIITAIMLTPMITGGLTFWLSFKTTKEIENESNTHSD